MESYTLTISIASIIIASAALIVSWLRTNAVMKQVNITSKSLDRVTLNYLFTTFNQASQICFGNPDVFYAVDGLEKSIPPKEAKNIAYLGILIDAFQQFYGYIYNEDFSKMLAELKEKSTYLNNLLAIKENQERWETIKRLHYGSFDDSFVKAIDELIQCTESNKL